MKYTIRYSGRFKKSFKLCMRRGLDVAKFETVVACWQKLGHCQANIGLICSQVILLLLDTGTHSDIF